MSDVFADTSFFVALLQPGDAIHSKATEYQREHQPFLLTTEFVLIEVANFFSNMRQRPKFDSVMRLLTTSGVIVPASDQWFLRGRQLFSARPDKHWSLTDCISFEVMRDNALQDALTADHHFEQAGFTALLKQ